MRTDLDAGRLGAAEADPYVRLGRGGLKIAAVVFLLAFYAFALFTPQSSANVQVVTRLALPLTIVELGELNIDRFEGRTVDKAFHDGHYYSDKAPGHSLMAVPAVALGKALLWVFGAEHEGTGRAFDFYNWFATLLTNGFPSAVATALLFLVSLQLGATRAGALFGAFALSCATPFLGWSTAFFAHSLSAALMVFVAAVAVVVTSPGYSGAPRAPMLAGAILGVLSGLCVSVDLTSAPVLAALAFAALLGIRRAAPAQLAGGMALGAAAGLAPLLLYNHAIFGNPFTLGYSSVVGFDGMKQGFFGITVPSLPVLREILIGEYRGLLPLSPVLVLVPVGLAAMLRVPGLRGAALVCAWAMLSYLWINSSYHYWNGGFSTGPRHIVPALPFAAATLAFLWALMPRMRWLAAALLVPGAVISAVCAAVDMFAPDNVSRPLRDHILPQFLARGDLFMLVVAMLPVWVGFAWMISGRRAPAAFWRFASSTPR